MSQSDQLTKSLSEAISETVAADPGVAIPELPTPKKRRRAPDVENAESESNIESNVVERLADVGVEEIARCAAIVESLLFVSEHPVSEGQLRKVLSEFENPIIKKAIAKLKSDFNEGRGMRLEEVAGGLQLRTVADHAPWIKRLVDSRPVRLSQAALEVLAIIAYRQPITRAEIEAVRGVAVNPNIVRTLLERNWVRVVGHREVPGRPELLGTTREFLDYFGLRTLAELPPLAELRGLEEITPQLNLPVGLTAGGADEGAAGEGAPVETAAEMQVFEYEAEIDEDAGDKPEVSAAPGMVAAGPDPAD